MKGFKFRLQSVLEQLERAMKNRAAEVERWRVRQRENQAAQQEVRGRQTQLELDFLAFSQARACPQEYMHYRDYRCGLERGLQELRQQECFLEENLKQAEQALQEAARAHRRMEILKERAQEEWHKELLHKEMQTLDEWGTRGAGRS